MQKKAPAGPGAGETTGQCLVSGNRDSCKHLSNNDFVATAGMLQSGNNDARGPLKIRFSKLSRRAGTKLAFKLAC